MYTALVSFNTTVRLMTKIFQWPKCLSKKSRLQVPSFTGNALCKTCFTLYICVLTPCNW